METPHADELDSRPLLCFTVTGASPCFVYSAGARVRPPIQGPCPAATAGMVLLLMSVVSGGVTLALPWTIGTSTVGPCRWYCAMGTPTPGMQASKPTMRGWRPCPRPRCDCAPSPAAPPHTLSPQMCVNSGGVTQCIGAADVHFCGVSGTMAGVRSLAIAALVADALATATVVYAMSVGQSRTMTLASGAQAGAATALHAASAAVFAYSSAANVQCWLHSDWGYFSLPTGVRGITGPALPLQIVCAVAAGIATLLLTTFTPCQSLVRFPPIACIQVGVDHSSGLPRFGCAVTPTGSVPSGGGDCTAAGLRHRPSPADCYDHKLEGTTALLNLIARDRC